MDELFKVHKERFRLMRKFEDYISISVDENGVKPQLDPKAPLEVIEAYKRYVELGKDLEPIR